MDRIELYNDTNKNDIELCNTLLRDNGFDTQIIFHEDKGRYSITVIDNDYELAKALLQDQFHNELAEEIDATQTGNGKMHIKSSDKVNDLKSSAISFIIVGILLVIFLVLKVTNRLPINTSGFNNTFINCILIILCIAILSFGIFMHQKSKKLSTAITSENDITNEVIIYFTSMYSKEKIDDEITIEQSTPPYFARIEFIQSSIQKQFPDLEQSFIEYLAEELYQILYETEPPQ